MGAGRAAPENAPPGVMAGELLKIKRRVDLIARPDHVADIDQIVADKGANAERQPVAELRLHFRHGSKLAAALLADSAYLPCGWSGRATRSCRSRRRSRPNTRQHSIGFWHGID
jgi:hypothetical protein